MQKENIISMNLTNMLIIRKRRGTLYKPLSTPKKEIRDAPSKLIDSNVNSFTEDSDIAEIFNNFFTEIGENLRKDIPHTSLDPLQYISYVENELQLEGVDISPV